MNELSQDKNKKISVIIPAYNAEKYITRCIDSVIDQRYKNWEIIIIDDGSTDKTKDIVQSFLDKDNRIILISQDNRGAGAARNAGIIKAVGEYLVFLDADDYIENTYFSLLAEKNEDVVFIDAKRINYDSNSIKNESISKYRDTTKDDIIRYQMTGSMPWGGWRKAVKRSLILDNKIFFSDHKVGEEAIYSFCVINAASSYAFIDVPVYNYEIHKNSLSQTVIDDPWGDVAKALKEKIAEFGMMELYEDTINSFVYTAGIVSLINMAKLYQWKTYKKKATTKINSVKAQIGKNGKIDKKHLSKKVMLVEPFFKMNIVTAFYLLGKVY